MLPASLLSQAQFDDALESGMRRAGVFLYYTECPDCQACEPSRLDVHCFRWTDSWRRIKNRGDKVVTTKIRPPSVDEERLDLFNRHRNVRGLGASDTAYEIRDYESFLVETCCRYTLELEYRIEDRLVAVSIIDCGEKSVSAVYTYFDPDYSKLSLGTYSILKQIEFVKGTGRQYVYLGMYVAENQHLNYKARFTPQQRWIGGRWVDFESNN